MYKKIVVPLDSSELAECVLPHLEVIIKGCKMPEVIFLHVIEPPVTPYSYIYANETDRQKYISEDTSEARKAAQTYLDKIIKSIDYDRLRLNVKSEIAVGKPAEVITDYATKQEADLIVIATHGRSGVSRWAHGSVADRVLRSSCLPVLMVRAPGCMPGM